LLAGGALLACIVLFIAAALRRRRRPPAVEPLRPEPPRPEPARAGTRPLGAADALRAAVAAFRATPDDATLDALRGVLFVRAGATPGATLADALEALGARDPDLAHAMAIAERARFGPAAGRPDAVCDLLGALEKLGAVTA
jgi:hypothetical protein